MYTVTDFKTKKALKEAVKRGEQVEVYQPNDMFGTTEKIKHSPKETVTLEGPHYPKPHSWYARAEVEYGIVKKVK
jgi:hypothetical protein